MLHILITLCSDEFLTGHLHMHSFIRHICWVPENDDVILFGFAKSPIFKICTLEPPLGKWMWTLMNIITRARYLWWSLHCVKWTTVIGPRRWGLLVGNWTLGYRMSDLYISWRTLKNSSCWYVYYIPCFSHKGESIYFGLSSK